MEYLNINITEPTKDYCRCKIITNLGREIEVNYYSEFGIFIDEDDEYGWIDNGFDPELVVKWKEI
jgi:hypothetical protein